MGQSFVRTRVRTGLTGSTMSSITRCMEAAADRLFEPRRRFVQALQAAKHSKTLKLISNRPVGEGPNKLLGSVLRISPSRIGEFLDPDFFLTLAKGDPPEIFPEARLAKAISGFAASVERARSWLERNPLPETEIKGLHTVSIIEAYWPRVKGAAPNLSDDLVRRSIDDGINSAATEGGERISKIDIELWIPNWGPLGDGEKRAETAFYSSYGSAILRGIDPVDANIQPRARSLAQTLALPARAGRGPWVVAVGPYSTLHRRFAGYDFLTFPLQFPLVGLIASRERMPESDKISKFNSLLTIDCHLKRVVVEHDVGHYVLCSMVPDIPENRIKKLPTNPLKEVPGHFLAELSRGEPVAFLGDGMLAFEIFGKLLNNGYSVHIIHQNQFDPEFSFLGGMMFREEDKKFAELLRDSQRQLFLSQWRVQQLFETFLRAVIAWHSGLQLPAEARSLWPEEAPIFLLRNDDVAGWTKYPSVADAIVKGIRDHVNREHDRDGRVAARHIKQRNEWIRKLFQIAPTAGTA